jgi:hypothetical protein
MKPTTHEKLKKPCSAPPRRAVESTSAARPATCRIEMSIACPIRIMNAK